MLHGFSLHAEPHKRRVDWATLHQRTFGTDARPRTIATRLARGLLKVSLPMSFRSLPSLAQQRAVLCLTLVSLLGCDPPYGGAHCEAITLGTPPGTLPLGQAVTLEPNQYRYPEPFIAGTPELHCCVVNASYTPAQPVPCDQVDCEALYARVVVSHLAGKYSDEPCGRRSGFLGAPEGIGHCSVYLDGDRLIGVRARCDD